MPTALTPDQLQHALALRDLTDPEAGSHAIQLLVDIAVDATSAANAGYGSTTRPQTSPVTPATPATSMMATCSAAMPVP